MRFLSAITRSRHSDAYAAALLGFVVTAVVQLPPIIEEYNVNAREAAAIA